MYFSTRFDNSLVLYKKESKILIKYRNSLEYEYNCENKYSFVDYISNIGGIFGLWFGISFIDMSQLIKMISWKIQTYLFLNNFNTILLLIANIKAIRMVIQLLNNFKKHNFIS